MCISKGSVSFLTWISQSFSQKIPSHKYQFDVKQHKERLITSFDFSILRYRKDKHAKINFKKVYKLPSSDDCFDPLSGKRQDFRNDSVMQYQDAVLLDGCSCGYGHYFGSVESTESVSTELVEYMHK